MANREQEGIFARALLIIFETVPVGIAKVIDRKQVWGNRGFKEQLHSMNEGSVVLK